METLIVTSPMSAKRMHTYRWVMGLALGLIASLLAICCPPAGAAVYWTAGSSLGVVNRDGSYPTFFLGQFGPSPVGNGCGVAVDGAHVYWANSAGDTVGRANLDGTGLEPSFITGASEPCGVAVEGSHIYWANRAGGTLGRARSDGTEVDQGFVSGLGRPCGIAVDGAHVYWTDLDGANSIGRADIDGEGVEDDFIAGGACGVAVDAQHVFWSTLADSIGRADLDGASPNGGFISGLDRPCGVASDGTSVFWAEESGGLVGSAGVDGSAVRRDLVTGLRSPCGVAVDASTFAPKPPPPGPHFELGKVRHGYRRGVAFIPVRFPAPGHARLSTDRNLVARFMPERLGSIDLPAAGTRWVELSANRKTAAGRRLLRRLRRSGRQPAHFGLEYLEEGTRIAWRAKDLTLLARPARR